MDNLFTWEMLSTLAGASSITYLIVAYTKNLVDEFKVIRFLGTDLYAVLVGFVVLLSATASLGTQITCSTIALAFFNGFLVSATAGKMSDKAVRESKK